MSVLSQDLFENLVSVEQLALNKYSEVSKIEITVEEVPISVIVVRLKFKNDKPENNYRFEVDRGFLDGQHFPQICLRRCYIETLKIVTKIL